MQQCSFAGDDTEACDVVLNPPFFTDHAERNIELGNERIPAGNSSDANCLITPTGNAGEEHLWHFRVQVIDEIMANEKVAIAGSCDNLGKWQLDNCVIMSKERESKIDCNIEGELSTADDDSNIWSASVKLPCRQIIAYRYLICAKDPITEKLIVRRWETHFEPRTVSVTTKEHRKHSYDHFGEVQGVQKVDRGWLSSEIIVQFKFFNAPFSWKQNMKRRLLFVKVTPVNLLISCSGDNGLISCPTVAPLDDSLSNDTHDTRENCAGAEIMFSEVTTLTSENSVIRGQPQFGTSCGPNDLVIFHLTISALESTAYLIDLYTYTSKTNRDQPPHHLGYHYVLPNLFKGSEGRLDVPITCASNHRPLGMMQFGYLIIKPLPSLRMDMSISFIRHWNHKWKGLDIGHRGSGTSFKTNSANIRENTIWSLQHAANHGADMVEFDVQLSKDLVPVIYHDFMVYVSLKAKCNIQEHDFLALPMKELTLEQLRNLKVYHTAEGQSRETRSFVNDHLQEHQPFPQLADALDIINPHVGFNIEIKWSQRLQDGTMEEGFEHAVDRNLYIDCILDVVYRKAAKRRIVFSCFDPDICTMLRFKQNKYPVMFLTVGVTEKYKKYLDPRGNRIETAVFNSLAMELLGIVAHTEDLLRDPSQVNLAQKNGLIVFCWGDDNNSKDTIKLLKDLGLHAIIYDKLDLLTNKEEKQSVFLLQAKESQKEMLKLQALEMGKVWHSELSSIANI